MYFIVFRLQYLKFFAKNVPENLKEGVLASFLVNILLYFDLRNRALIVLMKLPHISMILAKIG